LTGNNFRFKTNSPDAMLYLNRYRIGFKGGSMQRLQTICLHDLDKKLAFCIVSEGTKRRYLLSVVNICHRFIKFVIL
jgi:hypothetical protein